MTGRAPAAAVIGWPIGHSRSPVIHRHWLEAYGIAGTYERLAVPPGRIDAFLEGFAEEGLAGANVTIPHKEAAARHAEADAVGTVLGAVNTLWLENGRLRGTNTDVYGFLASCDEQAPGWDGEGGAAVVAGAGGSARAVVYALAGRGFDPVIVVNRSAERAEALAALAGVVRPAPWHELQRWLSGARLFVNTTSLGMSGQPPLPVDLAELARDAVVADVVYVPLVTPLLAAARARGLRTIDGLGMLLHQAVPGFELWFGRRPEVTAALRAQVEADLAERP